MAIHVNFEGLARASAEVDRVKFRFDEEIKALEDMVNETTVNDWKGPDANLFVSNTKAKIENLRREYNEFLNDLSATINEISDDFRQTQEQNIRVQG